MRLCRYSRKPTQSAESAKLADRCRMDLLRFLRYFFVLCLFSLYALLVFLVVKLFAGQKWAVPLICSHVFILSLILLTIFLRLRKYLDGHNFDNIWPHQQKEIQQKWRLSTLKLCVRNGDEWHSTAEQMIRSGGGPTERHNGTKVNNEDAASVV